MTSQPNIFVFIDEDQQKKYSKTTLSAINAQVAKYAHKKRHFVPKSRSVRRPSHTSSTPNDVASTTETAQSKRSSGKSSSPVNADSQLKPPNCTPGHHKRNTKKQCIPSKFLQKHVKGENAPDDGKTENAELAKAKPEDLYALFDRLCRITKLPTYQEFPFFLNIEERRLTHYWFTQVIQEDFGMSKSQFENSFQSCLVKYPLSYQVPLRWMIAHSAKRLYDKTGSHSLAVVYRNQQEAFRKLQGVLLDANASIDEVVSSLHQTIVHDPGSRKLHLRGSDAIIEARGGLEKVIEQCRVIQPDHLFLQYTFATFDIDRYEELETLKCQFFQALLAIQESSADYVAIRSQMKTRTSTLSQEIRTKQGGANMQIWQYIEHRERLLGSETIVGQLIRKNFDRTATLVAKSRLFAALFHFNAILIECHTTEEKSAFFQQLEKSADILSPVCVDAVTGSQRILPGTFIFMVAHVNRQIREQSNNNADSKQKGVNAAITGIAALKLYGQFSDPIRERLHSYLQNWILGQGNAYLKESDITALSNVITQLWLRQKRSRIPDQQFPGHIRNKHDVCLESQVTGAADTIQSITDEYLQNSDMGGSEDLLDTSNQAAFVHAAVA